MWFRASVEGPVETRADRVGVALLVGALLAACGPTAATGDDDGGSSGADSGGDCTGANCLNKCPDGTMTTISGTVKMPNGIDPVPQATVYVPREVTEFPGIVQCEVCSQLNDISIVSTETGVDGRFSLGPIPTAEGQQPGFTSTVVAQIGRFRKLAEVTIDNPCGENNAGPNDLVLPARNDGYDNIPNIAVATGDYDVMECVLHKIGIDYDAFDLYNSLSFGSTPGAVDNFDALIGDLNLMKTYNIIFLNCTGDTYESLLADPTLRGNIEDYVLSGGRLYVTDWSYDYVEQVEQFCSYIDFEPGADSNPTVPEEMNAATIGDDGITTEAQVLDEDMAAWLRAIEAVTSQEIISDTGTVHIAHFLIGWVMQHEVPANDSVKVWLTGNVSGGSISGERPLTTTFDYNNCGRVLYTSYHTRGRDGLGTEPFPTYCDSEPLSPQERVLEYLILHIADCIEIE